MSPEKVAQSNQASGKVAEPNSASPWEGCRAERGTERGAHLSEAVTFLDLMADGTFSTTVDMTDALRQMAAQGWVPSPDGIAVLGPHRRTTCPRFGDHDAASLHIPPGLYDSALRPPVDVL